MNTIAKIFSEIVKFNPWHDRLGRFSASGSAASFTYAPGKSKDHDLAIAREKERTASTMPTEPQSKTLKGIENRTRNLKKEQFRVVDRDGNVIMQKQGDKSSVSYKVGEARENFHGNITIHNHPDGGTFSTADLSDIGYGATEIRAASPEGTYVLRNTRYGTKISDGQKTWVDMRNELELASLDFKSHFAVKKEVKESFSEDQKKLKDISDRWLKAKNSGASQEELDTYIKEYDKTSSEFKKKVESATRKAYTDQYHNWYKKNSMKYGLEYEFHPVRKKVRKSFFEGIKMDYENIKKSDDVILDRKMNEDIEELTDSIMDELIGNIKKPTKNDNLNTSFKIKKADEDKRLVFGWALVSATKDGNQIIDHQGDIVDQDELEDGAYEYVLNFRDAGEEHIGSLRKKARMVESVVFTDEKMQAMGIPAGTVPYGWWIGFYVDDDETWKKIKDGTYQMFSIEGRAIRETVKYPVTKSKHEPSETVAKTFSEVLKFNPYHDSKGRFTSGNGGAATFMTIRTKDPSKQHMADKAIARQKQQDSSGGVKAGDIRERKGLKVKVLDVNGDKTEVEVIEGKVGTRKPGSKFTVPTKTLENGSAKTASGGTKAISILSPDGTKISYRQHSNGQITDMNDFGNSKNTNGMTLDQLSERAKKLGWKVTSYDDKQLKDYDNQRAKERNQTSNELDIDWYSAAPRPRKGMKGH